MPAVQSLDVSMLPANHRAWDASASSTLIHHFAQQNSFSEISQPALNKNEPMFLARLDGELSIAYCLEGTVETVVMQLFGVRMRFKGDRTGPGTFFTVLHFKIPHDLPHLFLDSHVNDAGILSGLPVSLIDNQRLKLEGDFDSTFDFYAPKGLNIEALQVLTPDIMDLLQRQQTGFDLEIIGKSVFVITSKDVFIQSRMLELMAAAQKLHSHLKTKQTSQARPGPGQSKPQLRLVAQTSTIRAGSRRLIVPYGIAVSVLVLLPLPFIVYYLESRGMGEQALGFVALGLLTALIACLFVIFRSRPR